MLSFAGYRREHPFPRTAPVWLFRLRSATPTPANLGFAPWKPTRPTLRAPSRGRPHLWEVTRCPRRQPSACHPAAASGCCQLESRRVSLLGKRSSGRHRSSKSWSKTRSTPERAPYASTSAAVGSILSESATTAAASAQPISGSPASAMPPASIRSRGSAPCAPSASEERRCPASPVSPSSISSRRPARGRAGG